MYLRKNKVDVEEINDYSMKQADEHEESQKWIEVRNKILSLKPKEALVLNLFYLEERKINEITSITGWSESNTKVLLHRARKNLQKLFNIEP